MRVARLIFMVSTLVGVFVWSCLPVTETAPPPRPREDRVSWILTIETEGGLAGRGMGGITLDSKGEATVSDMARQCNVVVSGDTLLEVDRKILAAKPVVWKPSYAARGADRFIYRLTMTMVLGDESTTWQTTWEDGSKGLTGDLVALFDTSWRLRDEMLESCGPGQSP